MQPQLGGQRQALPLVTKTLRPVAPPPHRDRHVLLHLVEQIKQATHRLACSCGARVLDLLVCEVCGDVCLGGYKAERELGGRPSQRIVLLTPDQPDLEGVPDRVSLSRRFKEYAVFWPLPHDPGAAILRVDVPDQAPGFPGVLGWPAAFQK